LREFIATANSLWISARAGGLLPGTPIWKTEVGPVPGVESEDAGGGFLRESSTLEIMALKSGRGPPSEMSKDAPNMSPEPPKSIGAAGRAPEDAGAAALAEDDEGAASSSLRSTRLREHPCSIL